MSERNIKDRQWWPSDYADEVMPAGMAAPQDWLIPMPGGVPGFTLASQYHDSKEEEAERISDGDLTFEPLVDGERIEFMAYDDFGDLRLNIAADGSFTVVSGTLDPRADHFWEWFNHDGPSGDSLEEFAKQYAESDGAGEDVNVGMGSWSHTETFAVQIADGKAALVSAGTA